MDEIHTVPKVKFYRAMVEDFCLWGSENQTCWTQMPLLLFFREGYFFQNYRQWANESQSELVLREQENKFVVIVF